MYTVYTSFAQTVNFELRRYFFVLRCVILCSAHTLPCNVAETATGNNVRFKDHFLLQLRQSLGDNRSSVQCMHHGVARSVFELETTEPSTQQVFLIQFVGGAVQVGVRFVFFLVPTL